MRMRLRMLKHGVGKGRHVMKQLHVCLSAAILRYSGYRARGVCALQSSSFDYFRFNGFTSGSTLRNTFGIEKVYYFDVGNCTFSSDAAPHEVTWTQV